MKKRILSWLFCLSLVVTILPVFSYAAEDGAGSMEVSEAGLDMIKHFEGFSPYPYQDGTQWTIGYGIACDPAEYPNGISEDSAEALLRETVGYFEDSVSRYMNSYGISLEQHQFDALVSITYNLGVAWINSSYRFWSMLRSGLDQYTDNQIASAIGVWCHVGSSVNTSILQRRITEIRLFLYGDYTLTASPNFRYLLFNGNGGSISTDVMLYRENEAYTEFPTAERNGYYFDGWYTAREGGQRISSQDLAVSNQTVYARWSTEPVSAPAVPADGAFSDVKSTDWFYSYVTELSEAGIISGYSDGTYRPSGTVTAGQALKLVLLAAGYGEQAPTSAHWASGYADLALENDLLEAGKLESLDAPISRLQIARLAAGAMGLDGSAEMSPFVDTDDGAVIALNQAGILEGSLDGSGNRMFYPEQSIRRSELAKIVWTMEQV